MAGGRVHRGTGDPVRAKRDTIFGAVSGAIADRASQRRTLSPVPDSVRIDGKVCLVTGANSGLGKAVAVDLARRGGHVLMACRSGHPEAGEDVRRLAGSDSVEMLKVDLADLDSVHALCDELKGSSGGRGGSVAGDEDGRRGRVDIAVLNAGVMPRNARRSAQGYDLMFAVHFLANRLLIDRLLADGTARPSARTGKTPRIVFVASEMHRSAGPIDFDRFGAFTEYGIKESLKHYGLSKLLLCTFAAELSRRLNPGGHVQVAVHAMCPGGVATNIARDAPPLLKPIIAPIMRGLFQSPEEAVGPALYLCCAEAAGHATGMYLHMMQRKSVSPAASDPENGIRLWEASEPLVAKSREAS